MHSAIRDPKTKVVSFDVFDTLLLRPFWFPYDLFEYLNREASRMLGAGDIVSFSACRRDAEHAARRTAKAAGREDATFQEIYDVVREMNLYPPDVVDRLMALEKELELRFCYPRKSAVALLKEALDLGKRVVAVSDMYLPSDFIKILLEKNGITGLERIFVSCEAGVSKASGRLYDYVSTELNVKKTEIVHIGDNRNADVRVPRRQGIRAFAYYRTIDLLSGKVRDRRHGRAFAHAYQQVRSTLSNNQSLEKLGVRCMLAVAANMIYDNPYRPSKHHGDYAGDPELFGMFALGPYVLGQTLWIDKMAADKDVDRILFFARDGYLHYQCYCLLDGIAKRKIGSQYVRISRRALLPLILSSEKRMLCAGSHIGYLWHSPKSLTETMSVVLKDHAAQELGADLSGNNQWESAFHTNSEMMMFIRRLYDSYVDSKKMEDYVSGFVNYYKPLLQGKILTFDVGYHLRDEILLKSFFPETDIVACYTHATADIAQKRSELSGISANSFLPGIPYVSWEPREMFLQEDAPSCVAYHPDGAPIMAETKEVNPLVVEIQKHAMEFIQNYISVFQEDLFWLPMDFIDAALPMESFLHKPGLSGEKWVRSLELEDSMHRNFGTPHTLTFWRTYRTQYWVAKHHGGQMERYFLLSVMLLFTDRNELVNSVRRTMTKKFRS